MQKKEGWWTAFWLQSPVIGSSLDPATAGIENDIMESFHVGKIIQHANHYNGYGVEQDKDTAIYWFRKAASEGYSASIEFLDENNIDWISNDDYPDLPF